METFEHNGFRVVRWRTAIFDSNVYMIVPAKGTEAALIDAGGGVRVVSGYCKQHELELKYIILTHGHFDHTVASGRLKRATGAKVLAHRLDKRAKAAFSDGGTALDDGDIIKVGPLSIEVLGTPGHTIGGITLSLKGALFTGDTLFARGIGRTDFKGGDIRQMTNSLNRLKTFPDNTAVYPGHGPESTIGIERSENPFLR